MYIFLVFLILLNIFLAIIAHSYDSVYEEMEGKEDPFAKEIYNSFKKFIKRSVNLLRGKEAQELEEKLNEELEKDGDVTREDLMDIVKGTDLDVDKLMAKYDMNGNGLIDAHELEELLDGIDRRESRDLLVRDDAINLGLDTDEEMRADAAGRDRSAIRRTSRTRTMEMTTMGGRGEDLPATPGDHLTPGKQTAKLNLGSAPGTPKAPSGDAQLQKRVNGVENKLDEMMKVLQAALPDKSKTKAQGRRV